MVTNDFSPSCSCSQREKTFSGSPAHFIQSGQRTLLRGGPICSDKRMKLCKLGDVERREGTDHCKMDRKLAKLTTTLTAAFTEILLKKFTPVLWNMSEVSHYHCGTCLLCLCPEAIFPQTWRPLPVGGTFSSLKKLDVMLTIQSGQIHLFLAPGKEGGLVRYLTDVSENQG